MKDNAPIVFFGLVMEHGILEPFRVQLSREAQREVTETFDAQRDSLLSDRQPIDYAPGYTLEPDEIFAIRDYPLDESIVSAVRKPDLTNDLTPEHIVALAVKALIAGRPSRAEPEVLFQHIEKRQVLVKKRTLFIADGIFHIPKGSGLTIAEKLDAAYTKGTLYFTSDHFLKRFLDVALSYQEATNEQVTMFLEHDLFSPTDLDVSVFDRGMRMRVRLILENKLLSNVTAEQIREIGKDYRIKVRVKDGQIELPSTKKEVKDIVRLLVEEYYSGHFTGVKYLANSKRRV